MKRTNIRYVHLQRQPEGGSTCACAMKAAVVVSPIRSGRHQKARASDGKWQQDGGRRRGERSVSAKRWRARCRGRVRAGVSVRTLSALRWRLYLTLHGPSLRRMFSIVFGSASPTS